MKKITFFVILLSIIFLAVWYLQSVYGLIGFRKNSDTPKEFLNHTQASQLNYSNDSALLIGQLKGLLVTKTDFFHNTAYYNSTQVMIDSILYSPDFSKLAIFVIIKNPTDRQAAPSKGYDWYYDATCYLGIKRTDSIELSWLGPSFTNATDKQNISNDIREACFRTFVTKDTVGAHSYKYNLNDLRFWNSSIWGELEKRKEKAREFEMIKEKHPEDVYEPKK